MIEFYILGYVIGFLIILQDGIKLQMDFSDVFVGAILASFLSWVLVVLLIVGKIKKLNEK